MDTQEKIEAAERRADEWAADLIEEFQAHCREYAALYPEDKDRKREIFEGWAIQKIAGLQLAVTEIAERLNTMVVSRGG